MKEVIIMRGIPGSGKSHWAREFKHYHNEQSYVARSGGLLGGGAPYYRDSVIIISMDDWMTNSDGVYRFDHSRLDDYSVACFRSFEDYVTRGANRVVIVDNTNLSAWQIAPYVMTAKSNGYKPTIVSVACVPEVAFMRQVHNVPKATHDKMVHRYHNERLPNQWRVKTVIEISSFCQSARDWS